MNVTKILCVWRHVVLALTLGVALSPAIGWAQQVGDRPGLAAANETTAWFLSAPALDEATVLQVRAGLEEALSGEGGRHLVGEEAFRAHVHARRPAAPTCLYGVAECVSAESMTFDALDLALVIRVKVRRSAGVYEAAYRLIDRRGSPTTDRVVRASTPRDLGFALVREIYNATGLFSVVTTPEGARVLVDGAQIGTTPLEDHRLPIGRHQLTLQLEDHRTQEATFEVSARQATRVEVGLELLPGMLVLEDTPPGAMVYIEGRDAPITPNQPIELAPGAYSFEVRAEGYESVRDRVEIKPGLSVRRAADMRKLSALMRDISRESIIYNRYIFRVTYDLSLQNTSFRGARTRDDELGELVFRQFVPTDEEATTDPRRFFSTGGLRLDAGYSWENFGLVLLSLAYLTDARNNYEAVIEDLETGQERPVDVLRVSRLQLRPFQLFYRHFFRNIVPSVELGLGINFQWVTVLEDGAPEEQAYSLSQTEAFWSMELGVQYFFTPNFFATARYNFHDHFNLGVGTEHALSIGVGGAFPNLFGFEPEPPEKL